MPYKLKRNRVTTTALTALAVVAVAVACGCGCGGEEAAKPTAPATRPTTPGTEPTTPTTPAAPAAPLNFTAVGNSTTGQFPLKKGLALFDLRHIGTGSFVVDLLDANGVKAAQLVNVQGQLTGRQSAPVQDGSYSLEIEATGDWTIDVTQPAPVVVPFIPQVFAGVGMDVTGFFKSPNGGLAKATITNHGSGKFEVTLLRQSGEKVLDVVNTVGQFDGVQELTVEANVNYVLDIESDGTWSITLE